MKVVSLLFSLFMFAQCSLQAYPPLLISSTRLVKGLVKKVGSPKPNPYPLAKLDTIIKNIISHCSSDAYVLINQPGLTHDDFATNDQKIFFNVQKEMDQDSTVVAFPYIESPISFNQISKYIVKNCRAEVIRLDVETQEQLDDPHADVPKYIDTKTRVILVNLPKLPTYKYQYQYRNQVIHAHDKYLREVLRKIPSPYVSVFLTSLDTTDEDEDFFVSHPKTAGYMKNFKQIAAEFDPVSWLTNDKRRLNEESIHQEYDFDKPKNKDNIVRKNKYEIFLKEEKEEEHEILLFTKDFFMENEGIIIGLLLIVILYVIYFAIKSVVYLVRAIKQVIKRAKAKKSAVKEKKDKWGYVEVYRNEDFVIILICV